MWHTHSNLPFIEKGKTKQNNKRQTCLLLTALFLLLSFLNFFFFFLFLTFYWKQTNLFEASTLIVEPMKENKITLYFLFLWFSSRENTTYSKTLMWRLFLFEMFHMPFHKTKTKQNTRPQGKPRKSTSMVNHDSSQPTTTNHAATIRISECVSAIHLLELTL